MSRYQLSKSITNSFQRLEKKLDDTNINIRMVKTAKVLPIFVRVDNFLSFLQLLEVVIGEYKIKIINNKQIKIQKLHRIHKHSERA